MPDETFVVCEDGVPIGEITINTDPLTEEQIDEIVAPLFALMFPSEEKVTEKERGEIEETVRQSFRT